MNIEIKYGNIIKNFENKSTVVIGNDTDSDFIINDCDEEILFKLVYSAKYKNYVLINSLGDEKLLFNNKPFSKVLVPAHFSVSNRSLAGAILIVIENYKAKSQFDNGIIDARENAGSEAVKTIVKTPMLISAIILNIFYFLLFLLF